MSHNLRGIAMGTTRAAATLANAIFMGRYILSVDDEADVTDIIAYNLRRQGFEVETAATGREALDRIAERRPDLMLLDLMLPDIDGFAVCEILRRRPETATIPIVILSAWNEPDSRHLGLELGALDFLSKPFSPRVLIDRVSTLLKPPQSPKTLRS